MDFVSTHVLLSSSQGMTVVLNPQLNRVHLGNHLQKILSLYIYIYG